MFVLYRTTIRDGLRPSDARILRRGGSAPQLADPPQPDPADPPFQPFVPQRDELAAMQESIATLDVMGELLDADTDAGDLQLARDAAAAPSEDLELEPSRTGRRVF